MWILGHFSIFLTIAELNRRFWEISYTIFSYSQLPVFTKRDRMTDADKAVNLGSDPADIRSRSGSRLIQKTGSNPGSLSVDISALAECLLSESSCWAMRRLMLY